jgi:hypothetical protein
LGGVKTEFGRQKSSGKPESVLEMPEMRRHRSIGFKRKVSGQKAKLKKQKGPGVKHAVKGYRTG